MPHLWTEDPLPAAQGAVLTVIERPLPDLALAEAVAADPERF
jgi:hypothetical protein